jgi:hypothetical protein
MAGILYIYNKPLFRCMYFNIICFMKRNNLFTWGGAGVPVGDKLFEIRSLSPYSPPPPPSVALKHLLFVSEANGSLNFLCFLERPVLKVCITRLRYMARNFDAFCVFTIKFSTSRPCNFQTFQSVERAIV